MLLKKGPIFFPIISPKVVAFDAFFTKDKGILDYLLVDEFKKTKNLVLVTKLGGLDSLNTYDTIIDASHKKFLNNATSGFANMVINNKISYKAGSVTRNFLTQAVNRETNDTIYPWAVEVVRKYNPEVLNKLFKRNNREEIIDYVGNVHVMNMLLPDNYRKDIKWDKPHFQVIEYQILLDMINQSEDQVSLDSSIFKDKIVLFGYLGKRIDVEESGEDLFYTPLNEKYVGKTPQDMYGLVIHANIIANILRGDYIDESNRTFMHVIGFLITYLVFAFYRPIYDDHKIWYDGLTKFLGIALSLIILGVIGMIFDWLNYKIVFGAIWFGCILLAGDWLEIYYGLIKNLFNKIIKTKIQQS